jgi:hypothetical protein
MSQTPQHIQPLRSNNLIFIGSVKTKIGKNGLEQMQLGFNRDHINLLINYLNAKGWVNIEVLNGKNGKYMIVKNSEDQNIGHE